MISLISLTNVIPMLREIMAIFTLFAIVVFGGLAVWQGCKLEGRVKDLELAVWKVERAFLPDPELRGPEHPPRTLVVVNKSLQEIKKGNYR